MLPNPKHRLARGRDRRLAARVAYGRSSPCARAGRSARGLPQLDAVACGPRSCDRARTGRRVRHRICSTRTARRCALRRFCEPRTHSAHRRRRGPLRVAVGPETSALRICKSAPSSRSCPHAPPSARSQRRPPSAFATTSCACSGCPTPTVSSPGSTVRTCISPSSARSPSASSRGSRHTPWSTQRIRASCTARPGRTPRPCAMHSCRQACAQRATMPGSPLPSAQQTSRHSSATMRLSWSQRTRLAWASTSRTCATCSITTCPPQSRRITRKPAAQDATVCPRSACSSGAKGHFHLPLLHRAGIGQRGDFARRGRGRAPDAPAHARGDGGLLHDLRLPARVPASLLRGRSCERAALRSAGTAATAKAASSAST